MWVKICGMTNFDDAAHAADCGADAVGFILHPASKRFLPAPEAAAIARRLPAHVAKVAVVVNLSEAELLALHELRAFDAFQLHGSETPELTARLTAAGLTITKALGCPLSSETLHPWVSAPGPARFLLDRASPDHGGTGQTVDWQEAARLVPALGRPVILAGGLTPENVARAAETVQPFGLDVCSGVEAAPGRKDHAKVEAFLNLCRRLP